VVHFYSATTEISQRLTGTLLLCRSHRNSDVARELGIGENLLHRWKKKSEEGKIESFPGKGRLSLEDDELRQLRRENKRLRMERDILKKAVAIFSEEPQ